jgi:hypothetical protein
MSFLLSVQEPGKMGRCGLDWIDVAQDRDSWRALLNTVMETSGSIKCEEIFAHHRNVLASQEEPCSMHKLLTY